MSTNNHCVIIPTAGLGTRLGNISSYLNKSLVPFQNKPILSHIIERFPIDTKFIIPVGYLAKQVQDFCNLAYSDRNIIFVEIDDYTSKSSGPGYTVSKCIEHITGPFWYIPCDTYFTENLTETNLSEDTCFVKHVPVELSNQYTMFRIDNGRIIDMTFKQTQPSDWVALTGVMFIHDYERFIIRIKELASPEIIWVIRKGTQAKNLDSWLDFGNLEIYKKEFAKSQKYDFSKTDEITYICNNHVAKWWSDPLIAEKKYNKWSANKEVFPKNCKYAGNWLVYDYFLGTVVYESYNIEKLNRMLDWLGSNVWRPLNKDISSSTLQFYKTKTIARVNKFLEKYPDIETVTHINDLPVYDWHYYFNRIDWNLLVNENLPGFVHGDLHFDNIVVNENNNFSCIDWRHEFGDLVEIGDIYYDLAKLTGGFIINYSKIKQNEFKFEKNNGKVTLEVPNIEDSELYIKIVKDYVLKHGWNYKKVQLLIPIIFWNMAPLHHHPFDLLLWYLGIKFFEEMKND